VGTRFGPAARRQPALAITRGAIVAPGAAHHGYGWQMPAGLNNYSPRLGAHHSMSQLDRVPWRKVLEARAILGRRCDDRGMVRRGQAAQAGAGRPKQGVVGRRVEAAGLAAKCGGGTRALVCPNLEVVSGGSVRLRE
jgi:hypothetical protein